MEYNDDIASDMLQFVKETAPQSAHFSDIATSLANTANEFDQAGSTLGTDIDRILGEVVQIVGG